MKLITLIVVMVTQTTAVKPKPIVLHERGEALICAEYTSPSAPKQPNRSCVDASRVREWILKNGRPEDECSE